MKPMTFTNPMNPLVPLNFHEDPNQQDDWEYELDLMSDRSREALLRHLEKAPAGHPTAQWLREWLRSDLDTLNPDSIEQPPAT
jgi:hypothetical protein